MGRMESKGVEVAHQVAQVIIACVRLKAQLVLERNGEGGDQVQGGTMHNMISSRRAARGSKQALTA